MFSTLGAVLLASFLACFVTTIGIYVISRYEQWGREHSAYFMSFAAGVLITVSFLHIIPKSLEMHEAAPTYLLAGFLGIYLINRFVRLYVCHNFDCSEEYAMGIIPMLGIGFHSFVDGVIYSVTFKVSIFTGVLAAIGMVLHEFPEGIVTFVLLDRSGFSRKRSVFYAFLAAALTTPLGTIVSFPLVDTIDRTILGSLLAGSAGALIYVGATHLLPAVEQENRRYTILALTAGVLVALIILLSKR
ncbi:MAG: ZIP family metal transporter [Anaerolineae bacterium]